MLGGMRWAASTTAAGAALLAVWLAAPAGSAAGQDPFAAYLDSTLPPADGFDFPVGDTGSARLHRGWRVSLGFGRPFALGIHPGEDFTSRSGAAGQPVRAVAAGRVIYAGRDEQLWGGVVMIQHVFYENQRKRRIRSLYAHLGPPQVAVGEPVRRRQLIGRIGRHPTGLYAPHLHLELRWDESLPAVYWPAAFGEGRDWIARHYAPPSRFIRAHRRLFVPPREPRLVLVDAAAYRMRCYRGGRPVGDYAVSLGQGHGAKRRRGDLNTPRGMYFITAAAPPRPAPGWAAASASTAGSKNGTTPARATCPGAAWCCTCATSAASTTRSSRAPWWSSSERVRLPWIRFRFGRV